MTRSKASTSAWAALGSRQRPIANSSLKRTSSAAPNSSGLSMNLKAQLQAN